MRGIDQRWGVARTLLGLGALARLRRDPAGAMDCYQAALPILREIDSRPEIARCLGGIGRVALDQGQLPLARTHLAESLRLSQLTGARIGVARGLESFAALCAREGQGRLAVLLTAAAAALREAAGLPAAPAGRTQQYLEAARGLGQETLTGLWDEGRGLTPDAAVTLALESGPEDPWKPAFHPGAGEAGAEGEAGTEEAGLPGDPASTGRRAQHVLPDPARARDHRAYRARVQQ